MKYGLFSIIVFYCSCSNTKDELPKEIIASNNFGTLIIASVATDGILIAADSRSTFTEIDLNKNTWFVSGYNDSCQKIFVVKNMPVGCAGANFYDGRSLHEIVNAYNSSYVSKADPIAKFGQFVNQLKTNYPLKDNPMLRNNSFVTGFYWGDQVSLLRFNYINDNLFNQKGKGPLTLVSTDAALPLVKRYIPDLNRTSTQLKPLLEKVITEFGKLHKTVGGAISVIKINKDNSYSIMDNDFSKKPLGGKIIPIKESERKLWEKELKDDL